MKHIIAIFALTATLAAVTPVAAIPTPEPAGGTTVHAAVRAAAVRHGVPTALALAVTRAESNFNCRARGRAGELGPLQIKPATARGLGYRGPTSGLQSCGAGLEYGMRHLAAAYRKCGTVAGAARLHQRGLGASCHGRTRYSALVLGFMR